jgi:hypothetical protein
MGFIVYLMNLPVCWRSKAQRDVTLSRYEAEYVVISNAVKEVKFIGCIDGHTHTSREHSLSLHKIKHSRGNN